MQIKVQKYFSQKELFRKDQSVVGFLFQDTH
jgi:hypothetical protein